MSYTPLPVTLVRPRGEISPNNNNNGAHPLAENSLALCFEPKDAAVRCQHLLDGSADNGAGPSSRPGPFREMTLANLSSDG